MFSLRVCVSAVGATLGLAGIVQAGDGQSAGEAARVFAPVNVDGLGKTPAFIQPPMHSSRTGETVMDADPVLVPLPPSAWAAASGLVGLAVVAVWRRHKLRGE